MVVLRDILDIKVIVFIKIVMKESSNFEDIITIILLHRNIHNQSFLWIVSFKLFYKDFDS